MPTKPRYNRDYGGRGGYGGRRRRRGRQIDFRNTIYFACNEQGHLANKFPLLSKLKEQTCKSCGQFGHDFLDCLELREKWESKHINLAQTTPLFVVTRSGRKMEKDDEEYNQPTLGIRKRAPSTLTYPTLKKKKLI